MRRPFVAGNWKMNGSRERTRTLVADVCKAVRELPEVDVGLCPPFVYVTDAGETIGDAPVRLGGQTCAGVEDGAYTGEISATMLADAGCSFVLVGHSERRTLHGEKNADIAEKASLALAAGLSPVVCVGETLDEREAGRTETTVARQLEVVVERLEQDELARHRDCLRAGMGDWHRANRDAVAGQPGARVLEGMRRGAGAERGGRTSDTLRWQRQTGERGPDVR